MHFNRKVSPTPLFYISYYDDTAQTFKGSGFYIIKKDTQFLIKKFSTKVENPGNEVIFSNTNISMTYDWRSKDLDGHGIVYYFTERKKIFPSQSREDFFKFGTGFFISKNGYIVTNFHVIEHATNIYVSNEIYKRTKVEVVLTDTTNDIALLKVNLSIKNIPFNIVASKEGIGNSVFTLGYPLIESMGKEVKLTSGIVNSSSGFEDDNRYYQFSAEVQPGNSGGPLFDSGGNIIGLVSAKHSLATNAGYALKSKFVIDLVKLHDPIILKANTNLLKNLSLSSKYNILKDYVLLLEVE